MSPDESKKTGYMVAALVGAAGGGLLVLFATDAIPKMMKRFMAGMMENMRAQMGEAGSKPEHM